MIDLRSANRIYETIFRDDDRNGADMMRGDDGDDILVGGSNSDRIDGGSQDDLIFGDNVKLVLAPGSGNAVNPRYRLVHASGLLYGAAGEALFGTDAQARPGGNPTWADWTIQLDLTDTAANFGDDYIAGGANDDTIFGQRGDDRIQGDGSIDLAVDVSAARSTTTGLLTVSGSVEAATDGDDYIEGNAGADTIFGNLGQDDIIGGNSTIFVWSLAAVLRRDDGADLIFGGAGQEISRNEQDNVVDEGDTSHGRDSDMILGDNGNIIRLVTEGSAAHVAFTYDSYGGEKIKVRVADLADYTPGGPDFDATKDIGGDDELHGESGDDFIYGMKGADILFGEGQDDDLIGGWGYDWISGGTGDDGVIGDDGRILTSRNGSTEPLNGVTTPTVQQDISTPGKIQLATINVSDKLTKAVDLQPFGKAGDPLFLAKQADDVIYGGWGNDWLHGGWGDDAISGAEALPIFYDAPQNGGDVLKYSGSTTEFALYDEYKPMSFITGFLLNFDATEGPLDTLLLPNGVAHKPTDGDDRIFGDLGNDWIVGGTGRDTMYGGWGDDLINADDDQGGDGSTNLTPDTHASYEDRAYGGAGRDVLIGNTGGDRLIDWVGEFNSFIVPFAPFGTATVSRTLQPQLAEFLLALSKSDGADQTLGIEPNAELGMVRQQDTAWQDQTGGPRDLQAGNVPGGKRDVLRGSDFNTNQLQGFAADSGTWQVSGGALQVASTSQKSDAVAIYQIGDALPSYFEVLASAKVIKPTAGWDANSYIVFDYQSRTSFKFAGIDVSTNKVVIGQRTAAGWQVLTQASFLGSLKSDTWYNMFLSVNGLTATLSVNNQAALSYAFQPTVVVEGGATYRYALNWGLVGFGSNKARGALDNLAVQIVQPTATVTYRNDFTTGTGPMLDTYTSGTWAASGGRLSGTPPSASDIAVNMLDLSGVRNLAPMSLLELSTTLRTGARAGFVFDYYDSTNFKFAAIDVVTKQIVIGHRTASGWTTDAAVTQTTLNATTDYVLGVTIRGASVSITLNGQAVTGFVYNAVGVDGRFALFARGGTASFDTVTVKTNDAAVPAPQTAAGGTGGAITTTLAAADLDLLAAEARRRWGLVEDPSLVALLDGIEISIADLADGRLAEFLEGRILVDDDAAGFGWFVDRSPGDDREFTGTGPVLTAKPSSEAAGRIDLLSVLAHEMGHVLGFGHSDGGVMDELRAPGERALPDAWHLANAPSATGGIILASAQLSTAPGIGIGLSSFGAQGLAVPSAKDLETAVRPFAVHDAGEGLRPLDLGTYSAPGIDHHARQAAGPRIKLDAMLPSQNLFAEGTMTEPPKPLAEEKPSRPSLKASDPTDLGLDPEILERLRIKLPGQGRSGQAG